MRGRRHARRQCGLHRGLRISCALCRRCRCNRLPSCTKVDDLCRQRGHLLLQAADCRRRVCHGRGRLRSLRRCTRRFRIYARRNSKVEPPRLSARRNSDVELLAQLRKSCPRLCRLGSLRSQDDFGLFQCRNCLVSSTLSRQDAWRCTRRPLAYRAIIRRQRGCRPYRAIIRRQRRCRPSPPWLDMRAHPSGHQRENPVSKH